MITIDDVKNDLEFIRLVYRFFEVVNDNATYFSKIRFYNEIVNTLESKYQRFYYRYYIRGIDIYHISYSNNYTLAQGRYLRLELQYKLLKEIQKKEKNYAEINRM